MMAGASADDILGVCGWGLPRPKSDVLLTVFIWAAGAALVILLLLLAVGFFGRAVPGS